MEIGYTSVITKEDPIIYGGYSVKEDLEISRQTIVTIFEYRYF